MKIKSAFLFFLTQLFFMMMAQAQQVFPLYAGKIPLAKSNHIPEKKEITASKNILLSGVTVPTITVYKAKNTNPQNPAIIICPGGGYAVLSMKEEGTDVAEWFAHQGVTAIVLKYRLPNPAAMDAPYWVPMMDAQEAIYQVRKHAAAWHIDPQRVGILGFSAGGHLAATLLSHYHDVKIENPENINLRPDFGLLAYPVITFGEGTHQGSKNNLIGTEESLSDYFSNEKQVNEHTPATFIMHCADDPAVPMQANSMAYYQQLIAHKVPAEIHIFQSGGHGFGSINPKTHRNWLHLALNWMQMNEFVKP